MRIRSVKVVLLLCLLTSLSFLSIAQQCQNGTPTSFVSEQGDSLPITPGDRITIHVLNVPELEQPHLRVTDAGEIPALLLGSVKIAGLTPAEAARKIEQAYQADDFLNEAHVQVIVDEHASSEVTVLGYVVGQSITAQTNGLAIPLSTPKSLLAVLAMAGGFNEHASRTVTIQHHGSNDFCTVSIPNDPAKDFVNNVTIYPGDIITVPRAGIVYILGDVGRPTAVYMNEDGTISLMQALSQAGSPLPTAALRNVMVFTKKNESYTQLQVNVGKIAKGEAQDIPLDPQDVIWVPFSYGKNMLINGATIVAALSSATATGIVYTHY